MSGPVFVDTNVLVYAADARDPAKKERAIAWMARLWESGTGRVSAPVLHEYYVTVTRKLTPPMSREQARADIADLQAWGPVPLDDDVRRQAWSIEDRYSLSWWDALIVAAAQTSRCVALLTEDLQHGQRFDTLDVIDPFQVAP